MMFIIRTDGARPVGEDMSIHLIRQTPALASGGTHDFFCVGDVEAARARGQTVVSVHDGWYADDTGGGVAVWGQGRFWEIRETPFVVRESSSDGVLAASGEAGETVNVRGAIFGI